MITYERGSYRGQEEYEIDVTKEDDKDIRRRQHVTEEEGEDR